jgi:hypothetical protein
MTPGSTDAASGRRPIVLAPLEHHALPRHHSTPDTTQEVP